MLLPVVLCQLILCFAFSHGRCWMAEGEGSGDEGFSLTRTSCCFKGLRDPHRLLYCTDQSLSCCPFATPLSPPSFWLSFNFRTASRADRLSRMRMLPASSYSIYEASQSVPRFIPPSALDVFAIEEKRRGEPGCPPATAFATAYVRSEGGKSLGGVRSEISAPLMDLPSPSTSREKPSSTSPRPCSPFPSHRRTLFCGCEGGRRGWRGLCREVGWR